MAHQAISKGDRVAFIRADGSLDGEVVVHDVFGGPDTPANFSYINGNVEQHYHTDLVHRVGDTSPVKVPTPETWFICVGNNHGWGRSRTEKQAVANMKRQGYSPTYWTVHKVNQWTSVNGMGALCWPSDYGDPVEVTKVDKRNKKAA